MAAVSRGAMLQRTIAPEDEVARAIEFAPYADELWIVEDLTYAGGIAQLASVLAATDGLENAPIVGHGIAPAPFRNPAALAMEWAALARMYPGRLHAGVGHGLPAWMKQIGEGVDSPLTLLEETIATTRALLGGSRVDHAGRYVQLEDVELLYPPDPVPLVSAGVEGPRSLQLAGRVADGTVLPEGKGPTEVDQARMLIDAGRVEATVAFAGEHRLTLFTVYYCGDLRELPPPPDHAPPSGWDATGASPDEVAANLQTVVDAGVDSVVLVPIGPDPVTQLAIAANEIWPLLST